MRGFLDRPLINAHAGKAESTARETAAVGPVSTTGRAAKRGRLTPMAWNAVLSALEDEHDMAAFTAAIIARYGADEALLVKKDAIEERIRDLGAILRRYEEVVPDIVGRAERIGAAPDDAGGACQALLEADAAGARLYDEVLLRPVEAFSDIAEFFQRRISAAQASSRRRP